MTPDLLTGFAAGVTCSGLAVGLTAWHTARGLLRRAAAEATTDALTGALNRKGWEKAAASCANKTDGPHHLWVMLADCNGLKAINDTHGHAAGDRIIRAAAQVLRQAMPTATIARLGGDEFALLVPFAGFRALRASDRPLVATAPTDTGPDLIRSRIAIGATPYRGGLAAAMRRADAAMYRNKATGEAPLAVYERDCDDHAAEPRPLVRTRDLDLEPVGAATTAEVEVG